MRKLSLLFFAFVSLQAQSLQEIETYALQHSLEMEKTQLDIQKAKAKKTQHKNTQYGQLDLVGSYTHFNTSRTYKPLTPQIIASKQYVYTTKDLFSAGLNYDVALFTGFAQTKDIEIANLSETMATMQKKLTKAQILFNVRSLYLTILAQEEMLLAQQHYIDALKKLHTQIQMEVDLGKKAKIDLLKSQADIQNAQIQKAQIQSDIAITKATLSELVNEDIQEVEPVSIDVEVFNTTIEELLAQRDSLAKVHLQELQEQKAQKTVAKLHAKNLPQVMFNGYYGYNFGEDEIYGTWENENLWQVGVQAKWNIIDFGVTSAQIQEAKVAQMQASLSLEKTMLQLKKQLIEAKSKIDLSVAQYHSNTAQYALAQESAKIETVRYENSAATLNDLLLAKAKEQLAKAQIIQSKYNYQKSLYYLTYILEQGLEDE